MRTDQVEALAQELHEADLIDSQWRTGNTSFTWLKLPEWMQAEMVQFFGNSMDHTPFYRFPFMESVETFITVLAAETRICAARDGWFRTLLSDAWTTDFVGAIIFSLGFGALSMAAAPIKMALGESYPDDTLIEKLLVTAPRSIQWPKEHIVASQQLTAGVFLLTVGTFKKFTPALLALAAMPAVSLLRISNNSICQVRLSLRNPTEDLVNRLQSMPGCELAVDFTFPQVGKVENERQLCLSVQVVKLLELLRLCQSLTNVSVYQVYDFFNYD